MLSQSILIIAMETKLAKTPENGTYLWWFLLTIIRPNRTRCTSKPSFPFVFWKINFFHNTSRVWLFLVFKLAFFCILTTFDNISSLNSELYIFLRIGFLFADFEFRSVRRNLWTPILPRLSIMIHTCSLSELFLETNSCISPTNLSTDLFCLKISF